MRPQTRFCSIEGELRMHDGRQSRFAARGVLVALLAAAALPSSGSARAETAGRTMIVLDASQTMLRKIGSERKIEAAATVLSRVLGRPRAGFAAGVVAFGHRHSQTCDDFEVVKPLGEGFGEQDAAVLAGLKPQGPASLAQSMIFAVKQARLVAGDQLLLVIGSADACGADACGTAAKINKVIGATIDVVAIDSGDGVDFRSLRCIAKEGGGSYRQVTTSADLRAAVDAALDARAPAAPATTAATTADSSWDAETAAATTPAADRSTTDATTLTRTPEAAPVESAGVTTTIKLAALLAEPGPRITSGLVWRIFEDVAGADGQRKLIGTLRDAAPSVALPEGNFLINVAYGRANLTKRVSVAAGDVATEQFVLNAGGLRLAAALQNGETLPEQLVTFDILSDERDQLDNRATIAAGVKANVVTRLNAGIYRLVSTYGDANAVVESDVSVEAGKLTEVTVRHSGAKVSLRLVLQPGGEALANTQWTILTAEGDLVRRSVGALPSHVLAPGRYAAEARWNGKTFTQPFTVEPATAKDVEVLVEE